MARKPENTFVDGVHNYLAPKPELHREKMSNPYSSGTADWWYSGDKNDLWVEYKYVPRIPQRVNIRPLELLTPLQAKWLDGRYKEGRNVAVIIGCPSGGVVLRGHAWTCEISPEVFASTVQSRRQLAEWITAQVNKTR